MNPSLPIAWTVSILFVAAPHPGLAAETEFVKTTHIYKTVDGVKIAADVYRTADSEIRPVVVWIHGGALIGGSRESVPGNIQELCKSNGFALVSLDYRLAPEVKLPQIAEDLDDAFRWLREHGPKSLKIDPDRMVICGGSAGGFCTYLVASRLPKKPRAIVSYWGYGEFDPSWTAIHSKDHGEPVKADDAYRGVHHAIVTAPTKEQAPGRGLYYRFTRQNGIWPKEVTGFDPANEKQQLDRYSPIRHITSDFPPTLMVHGTIDTDVPYACSERMAQALKDHGVKHTLVTVENAGHGLSGGDKEKNALAHQQALDFIREHLK